MISIIMPVYNAEQFVGEAIESILRQTEKEIELIIINDGSSDGSKDIILSYASSDRRIRYFEQVNMGEAAARNAGLENAKGEFIAFQDADDISLPSRLETLKKQFVSEDIGIVHSDMLLINEKNEPIGYWQSKNISNDQLMRFFLKIGTPFNNPSMMIRKEVVDDLKYDTSFIVGTDTDMVFRISRKWHSVHVSKPLMFYRRHANNISNQKSYDVLFAHMQKFVKSHSLEELIPELDWENGDITQNKAKACSIISLFFFRRGMTKDGYKWYEQAVELAKDKETQMFITGIGDLIIGKYMESLEIFQSIRNKDHIVENYIGEAYAYLGKTNDAFYHFMNSLYMKPNYEEPMENLKALGSISNLHFIDTSWNKFHKKYRRIHHE